MKCDCFAMFHALSGTDVLTELCNKYIMSPACMSSSLQFSDVSNNLNAVTCVYAMNLTPRP